MLVPIFNSIISEWEIEFYPSPFVTHAHNHQFLLFSAFNFCKSVGCKHDTISCFSLHFCDCWWGQLSFPAFLAIRSSFSVYSCFSFCFHSNQVPITGLSIFFTFIYRSYLCILENYICTLYMCQIYFNILGFKHCLWRLLWHQTFKNHSFLHVILFFLWEIHPIKKKKSIVLLFHLRV